MRLWRRRILVTRPRTRAGSWIQAFTAAGAEVILFPVFSLELPESAENERTLRAIEQFRVHASPWLALTSTTGVQHLLTVLERAGVSLAGYRLGCVGPATRRALEERGLEVALEANPSTGADLARGILDLDPAASVVHATSSKGLDDIERKFVDAGQPVQRVVVSVHGSTSGLDVTMLERELADGGIDLLTFASPSAAHGFLGMTAAELRATLCGIPTIAVGPTTARALGELGFTNVSVAASPIVEDLVTAAAEALG